MQCYIVQSNALVQSQAAIPALQKDEILIQIKAIGLNRADLLQISGHYPSPDNSNIPGLEVAGIRVDNGQRVAALLTSGGYAEYVAVHKDHIINIPNDMTFEIAASLPESLAVTWQNLYKIGKLQQGMKVLIHGAGSGIGSTMVQYALSSGATVYATTRNKNKLAAFADQCHILSIDDDFESYIKEYGRVNIVIDILGSAYLNRNIRCCDYNGKIIQLANITGRHAEIDLGLVLVKNISIIGSTIRSKSIIEKQEIMCGVKEQLMPKILSNTVKPIISKIFDFSDMIVALQHFHSADHMGKIIVRIP